MQQVVNKARMFEFKPEGEVTTRFAQDGNGMPAPLMQVRAPARTERVDTLLHHDGGNARTPSMAGGTRGGALHSQ